MDASARLGLPYLVAGQMQKHVTVNEALTRLDVLVQTHVISRTTTAPPATPVDGDLYILPVAATGGDWAGRDPGDLVRADSGGWTLEAAADGLIVLIQDEGAILVRHGGVWTALGERLGEIQGLGLFGLNATADATNPFSARVEKALWTAPGGGEGGDLRFTFNKEATPDVLSLLFQSGWSGRAEMGLIGDDDLVLKVSDDGAVWHEAMRVDAATGAATFAAGAGRVETTILTADATWTPPSWARRVEVLAVGGGGGGGSGAAGSSATARYGGGGGGAGGMSRAIWLIDDLGNDLEVSVGVGGAGAASSVATGLVGLDGAASTVSLGAAVMLSGGGGIGGKGGTVSQGLGGSGGVGSMSGNRGGDSSISGPGATGASVERPDGAGGGGAGGGLNASSTVRNGGPGGVGAIVGALANGGAGGVGAAGGSGALPSHSLWRWAGGGGGGGGASISTGYAGGLGRTAAGGGGGGAGVTASGAGGAGGSGLVILTAIG